MKKIFSLVVALTLLISSASFAQLAVEKGSKFINLGVGVGGGGGVGGVAFGGSFDFGVAPSITVGAQVAYRSFDYGFTGFNGNVNYLYLAARGSYHFNELLNLTTDKVDLYAGIGLGYQNVSYSDSFGAGFNTFGSGIFVPLHIGGRYFFSEKIGGFAEVGDGIAPLLLGVTLKL